MPFIPDAIRMPWDRRPDKAAPNTTLLYPKSDNNWYSKSAAGVETLVGGVGVAHTPWTPTFTNWGASAPTSVTGRYQQTGKNVVGRANWTLAGAPSGVLTISLPVPASGSITITAETSVIGNVSALRQGVAWQVGVVILQTTTTAAFISHGAGGRWSATVPVTWASADIFGVHFSYEAA